MVPFTSSHVNPMMLAPVSGVSPTSPVIADSGTSVISVPARIANGSAVPRSTGAAKVWGPAGTAMTADAAKNVTPSTKPLRARVRRAAFTSAYLPPLAAVRQPRDAPHPYGTLDNALAKHKPRCMLSQRLSVGCRSRGGFVRGAATAWTSSRSLNDRDLRSASDAECCASVASRLMADGAGTSAVGVDGCPTGWVGIVLDDEREPAAVWAATITELAAQTPGVEAMAIDIPIGLPDHDERVADRDARKALGTRWQTVFLTPVRRAIEAATYEEANRIAREITGAGISRQAYALRKKILEVDDWIATAPCSVYEVHPELSFCHLADAPIAASKKTWAGAHERQRLLESAGIRLEGDLLSLIHI